jgi:flagellar hook assembly protein FlgD
VPRHVSPRVYEQDATTYIAEFSLPAASHVGLSVYNPMGRAITSLADGDYRAGRYVIKWQLDDAQGNQLPSGPYLLRLKTDHGSATGTAVIVW